MVFAVGHTTRALLLRGQQSGAASSEPRWGGWGASPVLSCRDAVSSAGRRCLAASWERRVKMWESGRERSNM